MSLFRHNARSTRHNGDTAERGFFSFFPLRATKSPQQADRLLPPDEPIKEETCPGYNSRDYFPVNPGDIFDGRYQVITKIGWGGSSTVWLARDVTKRRCIWQSSSKERFVTLKINNSRTKSTSGIGLTNEAAHERDIEKYIAKKNPSNPGLEFIRTHIDSFDVKGGPQGNGNGNRHLCLVYEPMREPVWLLRQRTPEGKFSLSFVKDFLYLLLMGIDYLHSECRVVHTDLKLENILIAFEDPTVIKDFVRRQAKTPMQRKRPDASGRTVYLSQNNFGPLKATNIHPKITDFGQADRIAPGAFGISPIQPDHYRAPEVILGCGWTYSADIWNLGLLMWNLLEGQDLFRQVHDDQGCYHPKAHLAEMIALLGPPPRELLDESKAVARWKWLQPIKNEDGKVCRNLQEYYGGPFFDKKGRFKHKELIPARKLEDTLPSLTGGERNAVLTFARKMLQWLPEERRTAGELLEDPFFHPRNINTS